MSRMTNVDGIRARPLVSFPDCAPRRAERRCDTVGSGRVCLRFSSNLKLSNPSPLWGAQLEPRGKSLLPGKPPEGQVGKSGLSGPVPVPGRARSD